jgi:hypothetical protein
MNKKFVFIFVKILAVILILYDMDFPTLLMNKVYFVSMFFCSLFSKL